LAGYYISDDPNLPTNWQIPATNSSLTTVPAGDFLLLWADNEPMQGEWVMFAGDADQSDFPSFDIKGTDKTIWFDNNGIFDYYFSPDFNLDGDINGQDKSLWFENNGISSRVPK